MRRHHFAEPEIDELIAREKYDEAKVKAMSPAARAQLAAEAQISFDNASTAYQAAIENARAVGEPGSPYQNPSIRTAQIRLRVAEGNLRMCGVDPYFRPSPPPPKWDGKMHDFAVDGWVKVCEAEAKVREAQALHEAAKRKNSKDAYNLSLEVHFAQQSLQFVETSAMLRCEGKSELEREQIRKAALERFKTRG